MRSKIKLLLTRCVGIDDDRLDAALASEAARLASALSEPPAIRRAYVTGNEAFHAVAAGAFDASDLPFDAMMDIIVPADALAALAPLVEGMAARLDGLVLPETSAILVGTEHVILPGDGSVLVLIANRRLPSFTHDGFLKYWLDYHGPFARTHTPPEVGLGYRQFHTDVGPTERFQHAAGFGLGDFDGAAECYYRDEAAVRQLMGLTEVVDQATVDEKGFVDHARCVTSVLAIR